MTDVYTLDKLATLKCHHTQDSLIGMEEDDGNGKQKWGTLHTYIIHQKLATSRNLQKSSSSVPPATTLLTVSPAAPPRSLLPYRNAHSHSDSISQLPPSSTASPPNPPASLPPKPLYQHHHHSSNRNLRKNCSTELTRCLHSSLLAK